MLEWAVVGCCGPAAPTCGVIEIRCPLSWPIIGGPDA